MNSDKNTTIAVSAYVIIAIFTFAYLWQRIPINPEQKPENEARLWGSMFGSVLWPIYWVGKCAFQVTKP